MTSSLRRKASVAAVGAAALLAYAHAETERFVIRRSTIPILDPGSLPLRVLHLSDVHARAGDAAKLDWVASLADLRPDVVIDTGDNVAKADGIEPFLEALGPLLALPGAFVLGSNDYYAAGPINPLKYLRRSDSAAAAARDAAHHQPLPTGRLVAGLESGGWQNLSNARGSLSAGQTVVDLVGVDDPHIERDRFPVRPARAAMRTEPHTVRIGVAHAPYTGVLDQMRADGVDLVLAGHTHGGQIRIPLYGALVTNCDLDRRRSRGLSGWPGPRPDAPGRQGAQSIWLNVSAGAGSSPYAPFRLGCPPEASLLTLVQRGPVD